MTRTENHDRGTGRPAPPAAEDIWEADTWVVAVQGDGLFRQQYFNGGDRERALQRLRAGEPPRAVFGWTGQHLPVARVRAVEWVPDVATVLVRRSPCRDPWRLRFSAADGGDVGRRVFDRLARLLPDAAEPVEARVGPNDLQMDPKFGLGILLAFLGLVALVGGAIEGAGDAPLMGPARRFRVFAQLGETLGVAAVLAIGAALLAGGVLGLVWWYRRRPTKWVVQRGVRRA